MISRRSLRRLPFKFSSFAARRITWPLDQIAHREHGAGHLVFGVRFALTPEHFGGSDFLRDQHLEDGADRATSKSLIFASFESALLATAGHPR
jgi:hypothetical protein